jgi:uncharacterized protein
MSKDNLEVVRRGYAAFRAGGPPAIADFLDEDVVWRTPEEVPEAGTYRGREAVVTYLQSLVEVFDELRVEPQELVAVDDHVVAVVGYHARAGGSGVELEWEETVVWSLRAGRVIEFVPYAGKQAALRALAPAAPRGAG